MLSKTKVFILQLGRFIIEFDGGNTEKNIHTHQHIQYIHKLQVAKQKKKKTQEFWN